MGTVGSSGGGTTPFPGGNGGTGIVNPIAGSTTGQLSGGSYYLAGGGGGGAYEAPAAPAAPPTAGSGGLGGGGAGSFGLANGTAGTNGTGGGGGGTGKTGTPGTSGKGGDGCVIIAYDSTYSDAVVSTGMTRTVAGGNIIYTAITGSGTITW